MGCVLTVWAWIPAEGFRFAAECDPGTHFKAEAHTSKEKEPHTYQEHYKQTLCSSYIFKLFYTARTHYSIYRSRPYAFFYTLYVPAYLNHFLCS